MQRDKRLAPVTTIGIKTSATVDLFCYILVNCESHLALLCYNGNERGQIKHTMALVSIIVSLNSELKVKHKENKYIYAKHRLTAKSFGCVKALSAISIPSPGKLGFKVMC